MSLKGESLLIMDKKTLIKKFSNTLKVHNEETLRINLYGYLAEIILSREIFKNNKDLLQFFEELNIKHKKYLYASRTLLIAKTIREIQLKDLGELSEIRNQTLRYLSKQLEDHHKDQSKESRKADKAVNKNDEYVENIIKKYSRSKQ